MNILHTRTGRALLGAALLAGSLGGCDFVESTEVDPNAVPSADVNQLFTAAQVNSFFANETEVARLAAIWLQQLKGADRQFVSLDVYNFDEEDGGDFWTSVYRAGGLNEIRRGIALAEEANLSGFKGIFQLHEAFLVGMAASVWGDVPYSEILQPEEFPNPALDPQEEVYDAVLSLLDEAIANLQTGQGGPPIAGADLNFGGDLEAWTAVAHSLKARFYMHLAEQRGASAYQNALNEAQQGIDDPANNWRAIHTTTATEQNLWHQFQRDRSGYIVPNSFFVRLLDQRDDPRLNIYFAELIEASDGVFTGAEEINIPATQPYDQPIVSCAETQFIEAEAALALGMTAAAEAAYQDGVECQEEYWTALGFDIDIDEADVVDLQEIITQKYTALFLNPEIWNDYKRTCLPAVTITGTTPAGENEVPPGLYYPQEERQTNASVPPIGTAPNTLRNTNDPNECT